MRNVFLLLIALLSACSPKGLVVREHHEQQYTVTQTAADSGMKALIAPYKRAVDTQMQVVIGRTDIPLTKAQPESTLGNFVADATLAGARKIDPTVIAAVSNYGGIRIAFVAPGLITRGKIFEIMPFDNTLAIAEIPGRVLQEFCDKMAASKGWPLSGISFIIRDGKATDVQVGGQALNPSMMYRVALSDYVARGGDNCDMLKPLQKKMTSLLIRDAMIRYLAALEADGKPLHPDLQKRIQYAD